MGRSTMKRSHIKILIAAAFVAITTAPTLAGMLDEKPNLSRSEDAKKNDALFDQEYRARRESSAAPEAKADPWASIRNQPAQPTAATKKGPKQAP
jgi:hypothetical protein